MAEKAQPVVEKAEAPSTPPEDVAALETEAPKKAFKMAYDPAQLPAPVNNHDMYVRASLIEARATRGAMDRIGAALERLIALLEAQRSAPAEKSK